jgi:outer membrane immunogenic protein
MKKILLASAAVAALCAPAFAADVPMKAMPAPMYSWTGCYGGIQAGYSAGDVTETFDTTGALAAHTDPSGALVGGTIGCNWQNGTWVWGLESDLAWTNFKGVSNDFAAPTFLLGTKSNWLNTDRIRLGVTTNANRLLIYATGGLAVRDIKATEENPAAGTALESVSHTRTGWTGGFGLESVAPDPRLTFKIEYLYANYGSQGYVWNTAGFTAKHHDMTENIIRFGINYRFGDGWGKGPVSAKY